MNINYEMASEFTATRQLEGRTGKKRSIVRIAEDANRSFEAVRAFFAECWLIEKAGSNAPSALRQNHSKKFVNDIRRALGLPSV